MSYELSAKSLEMILCYIGIGSNLGDRRDYIDKAIAQLRESSDIKVARVSSIYETEPVSDIPQGKYLNGVLEIETGLEPEELMRQLNNIEKRLGRKREVKNAPREIDLDILYYGDERIERKGLAVPHPRILEREFVLKGLRELGKA
jgi:2-amino-4-hydroxy-6-hydroxymethyldihydropteridine diphosphokinase